jgi:cobyrinic acid a,c-diamide synthase
MYLSRSIDDFDANRFEMCGILPARVQMTRSRVALGYVTVEGIRDTFLCKQGEQFRGHEFHYSRLEDNNGLEFAFQLAKESQPQGKMDGIVVGQTLACYAHAHFGSYPALAERLVTAACGDKSYD